MAERIVDPNYSATTERRNLFVFPDAVSGSSENPLPWQNGVSGDNSTNSVPTIESGAENSTTTVGNGSSVSVPDPVESVKSDTEKSSIGSIIPDDANTKRNGVPLYVPNTDKSDYGIMSYLKSLVTSPEEETRLKKENRSKSMILALADAARNIGNIITASDYATPQKFNNPVLENEQRYKADRAERERRNMAYYQAKQNEDAREQANDRWLADYSLKMNKENRDADLAGKRAGVYAAQADYYNTRKEGQKLLNDNAGRKAEDEHNERVARLGLIKEQKATQRSAQARNYASAAKLRSGGGGGGTATAKGDKIRITDAKGNVWEVSKRNWETKSNWASGYNMMRAKGKIKDGAGKTDQMGVYHDPDMKEAQTAMLRAADSKEFNDYITSIGGVKISSATPKKVTSPKKVATPKTSKAQNKVTPKPTPSKKAPKATAQKKGGMFNGMKV
jgi:hypothetical protein